jgi:hypothetical protein
VERSVKKFVFALLRLFRGLRSVHERWPSRFRSQPFQRLRFTLLTATDHLIRPEPRPCWLRPPQRSVAAGIHTLRIPGSVSVARLRLSPWRSHLRPPRRLPKQSVRRRTTGKLVTTGIDEYALWRHRSASLEVSDPCSTVQPRRLPCVQRRPAFGRSPWHEPDNGAARDGGRVGEWVVR